MRRRWIAALLLSVVAGICGLIFLYNYRITDDDGKVIEAVNNKLVLGAVRLQNKPFLVAITGDSKIGELMGREIRQISKVKVIPIDDGYKCNEDCQKIAAVLESISLYFYQGGPVIEPMDYNQAYFTANKHMLDEFDKLHVDQTMGYAAVRAIMGYGTCPTVSPCSRKRPPNATRLASRVVGRMRVETRPTLSRASFECTIRRPCWHPFSRFADPFHSSGPKHRTWLPSPLLSLSVNPMKSLLQNTWRFCKNCTRQCATQFCY